MKKGQPLVALQDAFLEVKNQKEPSKTWMNSRKCLGFAFLLLKMDMKVCVKAATRSLLQVRRHAIAAAATQFFDNQRLALERDRRHKQTMDQ